ncbi:hypothetical protein K8R33_03615 [archaeon]|nr:hypothetical protein [archaeon]
MKKIAFLVVITFVLLISGCSEDVEIEGPFIGGTDGLEISFVDGAPISQFTANSDVPIKIGLKNKGEYDLPENSVEVALYGLAMSDFSLSSDYVSVVPGILGTKKGLIGEGAQVNVDMGIINYQGSVSGEYINPTLHARVCYPYRTEAAVTACISSSEIVEGGGESVCVLGEERINSQRVSSSPIQITSFVEEVYGIDEVKFNMEVENKGFGDVYMDDFSCESLGDTIVKANKANKIHFRVIPEDVSCVSFDGIEGNEGYLKLTAGTKTLRCTMPVENTGANYQREITVFLDFEYVQSMSKLLKILQS